MRLLYSSNIPGVLENISISQIKLPEFYYRGEREDDEEIENLTYSLKQYGLLDPITVRNQGNYFEIVTGIRRYKASKLLGWRKILCHVIHVTDKEAYEISLMSNLQHKQLDPIEEATAFKKYLYNYKWGQISELAYKIGKSHSYIHRRLKLLECSPEIVDAISQRVEPSIAEEIVSIKNSDLRTKLVSLALEDKITCKEIRTLKDTLENCDINSNNNLFQNKLDDFEINQHIMELDERNQKLFNKRTLQ